MGLKQINLNEIVSCKKGIGTLEDKTRFYDYYNLIDQNIIFDVNKTDNGYELLHDSVYLSILKQKSEITVNVHELNKSHSDLMYIVNCHKFNEKINYIEMSRRLNDIKREIDIKEIYSFLYFIDMGTIKKLIDIIHFNWEDFGIHIHDDSIVDLF